MIRQKYFLVIVCKMSCYFSDAHSDAFHVKIFTVPKCIQFKPLLCKINKTKMILVNTLKKKKKAILHIYKTAADSKTLRVDLWLPRRRWGGRGRDREAGVSRCKRSHIDRRNNRDLLYSTGNCIQYPRISHNEKENEKELI